MSWLAPLWNSVDRLAGIITWANWGVALTVLMTFGLTVLIIVFGNRKETLIKLQDVARQERMASVNQVAADARERAAQLELAAGQSIVSTPNPTPREESN